MYEPFLRRWEEHLTADEEVHISGRYGQLISSHKAEDGLMVGCSYPSSANNALANWAV